MAKKGKKATKRPGTSRSRGKKKAATRKTRTPSPSGESSFVFRGMVQQRGAATLDQVPLTPQTIIVNATETLKAPEVIGSLDGMDITVQLSGAQRVTTGHSYIFHAEGWIYGDGLAVLCEGITSDTSVESSKVSRAVARAPEQAMKSRAARAELVITGRVRELHAVPRPKGAPITEHDPGWCEAVIDIDSVEHAAPGTPKGKKRVVVRFASNNDIRWAQAPKFTIGQSAVWMLGERDKKEGAARRALAGAKSDQYVVVDPEDVHPAKDSERIRALLKG